MKPKFVDMFMAIAKTVAMQSYAERLKVGSVAVKDDRIISIGYNGTAPGTDNTCEEMYEDFEHSPTESGGPYMVVLKQRTKKDVIHAEMNLIYKLARDGESGKGADLFITHAPCFECSKAILSVGFKKVWFREQYRDLTGVSFLKTHGVEVEQYDKND